MKKILLYTFVLFASANVWSQVSITEASGWLETAFAKWTPVANAESYNVYYTGGGETNKKIDEQLIRSYGTYLQADVLGLSAGNYTITIKPIIEGIEENGSTTQTLTVLAQDRTGFAFEGGRIPGGYNINGTPKSNAVILYITKNTKNSVSFNVITNNKGTTTNYIGLQNILYGIKKGYDTRPYIIRLIGNITDMTVMEGGDITIENDQNPASSLTLEGVGNDAVVNGMGVRLKSATNIEVRNLGFMNCNSTAGDNIGMQQDNDHVWIHNNDLFYGDAGSDADQVKGDGALDNKGSTYITMSYNHFWDSGKASLLGLSEKTTTGLYITYHHNWFDHSDSRHPRVRYYSAHIYNNYFDGNAKYGSGSTLGSSLFVEGNYYRNAKSPMLTSMQGTDIWNTTKQINDAANMGTFSGEAGGTIKEFNNKFDADIATNSMRFVAYGDTNPLYNIDGKINSTTEFDAYSAQTREALVPTTVTSKLGGNTYNNFDTDPALYIKNLTIQTPDEAKTNTTLYAGRVTGGDLKWIFNNAVDDRSYAVNTGLKAALTNYTPTLINVQGETIVPGNQTVVATTKNNNQIVSSGNAINDIVFTWGADATDATADGLPNGIISTKNTTAKTLTLSGIPTETMEYIVTTTGSAGIPSSDSGTITVLPPSSQVLTLTGNNKSQTITIGAAIAPIIFTWSGDATDVTIEDLPAGISAEKDTTAQTITITGTPTDVASTNYTVTTIGSAGTPVSVSGTISAVAAVSGDRIHNFTTSDKTSDFYTITGNMNSAPGTQNYDSTALTARLKMETATRITYTTTATSTLTLVFEADFIKKVKFTIGTDITTNTSTYTAKAGIITIENLPAGTYTISKGDATNLYYIKNSYGTLGTNDNVLSSKLTLYPNPVNENLFISSANQKIKNVTIYNLLGAVVKTISNIDESIDVSNLKSGSYLVKTTTDQGSTTQKIIKK